jgi:hypothetical protein
MSFHLTNLHTMIVSTHGVRKIAIGKIMRVALLAAAEGKFALLNVRGSRLNLNQPFRTRLEALAVEAEQQDRPRWWTRRPWSELRAVFVNEEEFLSWLDVSSTLPAVETPDGPNRNQRWIAAELERMKAAGEVDNGTRKTDVAKLLEKRMLTVAKTDNTIRPVKSGHISNMLRTWDLWPKRPKGTIK